MQGHALRRGLTPEDAHLAELALDGHEANERARLAWRRAKTVFHLDGDLAHVGLVDRARESLVERQAHADVGDVVLRQQRRDVERELGIDLVHEVDPELSFDVSALLPEDYVADVGVRLSLYKRLASAIDEAHVSEIAVEMEDRFGSPPRETRSLVRLMTIKCELRKMRVLGCEATAKSVTLHLRDDTPLDPKKVLDLVKQPRSLYKLTPDRLTRRFENGMDGLVNCETMLVELSRCWRD